MRIYCMNLSLLIVVTLVLSAKVLASSEVIEQRLHIDNVTEALFRLSGVITALLKDRQHNVITVIKDITHPAQHIVIVNG